MGSFLFAKALNACCHVLFTNALTACGRASYAFALIQADYIIMGIQWRGKPGMDRKAHAGDINTAKAHSPLVTFLAS